MNIIGIDPGKNGGIAVIDVNGDGELTTTVHKMPETERDICEYLAVLGYSSFAFLEKVGAMPGQGVTSMFTFGRGYGFLRGVLTSCQIPFADVRPAVWQRAVGISVIKGETNTVKKNRHKQMAQQLFPDLGGKMTHAKADALLIAEYGRRLKYEK